MNIENKQENVHEENASTNAAKDGEDNDLQTYG